MPGEERFPLHAASARDDAAIVFTSGSTGLAKGVAVRQQAFEAQVHALREMFDFRPGMKDMQAFGGFAIFDICLGMCSVIPKMDLARPVTAQPGNIVAAIRAHEPEVAFASPVVWQNTSRWCLEQGITLPSLVTPLTVGAPIPAYLHRRFQQILAPGRQIYTPYGATEAMPLTRIGGRTVLDETWQRTARGAGTCVGTPAPGADVRIVAITEEPIPRWHDDLRLPTGTIGEVVAGGPQVSPEYKDVPGANERAKIADGDQVLHRMGDLGYLDEQGRLWFCGRMQHRLQTAQGMVPAVPVEGIFNEHPDVFRTALVGIGSPGAHVPVLCVEMEPGRPWSARVEQELRALAQGTPHEGRVKRFLPHPGFPTDARHNSKIRREHLAPWAEARCQDLLTEVA